MTRRLAVVAALALLSGRDPCPAGTRRDPAREAALRARIAAVPYAALTAEPPPACFGDAADGAWDGRVARLDARQDDAALAGRLAHLGVHARDRLRPRDVERADRTAASELRADTVERAVAQPGSQPRHTATP